MTSFICSMANRDPMHPRGPPPNGRYVYGIMLALFSGLNLKSMLYSPNEFRVHQYQLSVNKPVRIEDFRVREIFFRVMKSIYRNLDVHAFFNSEIPVGDVFAALSVDSVQKDLGDLSFFGERIKFESQF